MISIPPRDDVPEAKVVPVEPLLLNMVEGAKALGIGQRMLWQLVNDGELPAVRIGRRVLVAVSDLRAWIEKQKTHGPGEYRRPQGAGAPRPKQNHTRGD